MVEPLSSVYERRIANEWRQAQQLELCNTDVLRCAKPIAEGADTILTITLSKTDGIVMSPNGLQLVTEHETELRFPRFFPAVPIEAYLKRPVFHPNVDPVNGFVCLWDRFSTGDTVITAIQHLQRIVAWEMLNLWTEHIMQPEAAAWHGGDRKGYRLPLTYRELVLPEGLGGYDVFSPDIRAVRKRLT